MQINNFARALEQPAGELVCACDGRVHQFQWDLGHYRETTIESLVGHVKRSPTNGCSSVGGTASYARRRRAI
jgi:hypothetical protein